MAERLDEITRTFQRAAIVGTGGGVYADTLRRDGLDIAQIELSPCRAAAAGAILPPDAETLPLMEGAHDLVLSGLDLHWANDPIGQLIQMRRALQPDGLFLGALLGGQTLAELRAAFAEAEAELTGGLSPRVAPMAEIRDLGALLQRAGLVMPVADSEKLSVSYDSALHLMRDLRLMGETNVMTERRRSFLRRDVLARACEIYARTFPAAGGRVRASFEIVFLTGWSPGPDQPQALRPGSARSRLADALGTKEIVLPDQTGKAHAVPDPDDP